MANLSDLSITRQESVLKFRMYIMMDDSNVLALKKVLEKRNLKELSKMINDESLFCKCKFISIVRMQFKKNYCIANCSYELIL